MKRRTKIIIGIVILVIAGVAAAGFVSRRGKDVTAVTMAKVDRLDITTQFLTEAMTLTAIGGVIGVALGFAVSAVVRAVSPLDTATPLWSVLLGLVVSISIGLFFGTADSKFLALREDFLGQTAG